MYDNKKKQQISSNIILNTSVRILNFNIDNSKYSRNFSNIDQVTHKFLHNLKAERVEKEKLKQLTLNINDRMEQEELQGNLKKIYTFI